MNDMARAIEKIQNSSDETSKIIKTIDDIAFQTNLLAPNAAVEAARELTSHVRTLVGVVEQLNTLVGGGQRRETSPSGAD